MLEDYYMELRVPEENGKIKEGSIAVKTMTRKEEELH